MCMIYKYVFDLLYYNNIYHTFDSLASASKQVVEIIIEIFIEILKRQPAASKWDDWSKRVL